MDITLKQIEKFSKTYNQDKKNKEIEVAIRKEGLQKACINQEIIKENQPIFNIELSETKRYDQKESLKCWIFAGINLIKRNMAENLNMDVMNLELSDNYIAFFDKLEKSNNIYEKVIHSKTNELQKIRKSKNLNKCVKEEGNWAMFLAILNKYGIVPLSVMPNTIVSENYQNAGEIYREKVKADVVSLLEQKKSDKDNKKKLEEMKIQFLQENYEFLSKTLGEPPLIFDYEYRDKNQQKVCLKGITPLEYRKKYVTLNLEDYIAVENEEGWGRRYNQKYHNCTNTNVYRKSNLDTLNVTSQELKNLVVKQLKDGIPVYASLCVYKDRDIKSGVLDTRLYDYSKMLGMKRLNKVYAMKLDETYTHHCMNFTGVYLENGKQIRWKVEDSYGDKEKVNGYYIMNDNYFDDFVITIIVDKKYLDDNQHKLWEQKAKLIK